MDNHSAPSVLASGKGVPLISVVMACHNAALFLREAVDSVLQQTYPAVELIVIDDGSTDGSREILARYGERIRVVAQANAGPYPARNRGIGLARGDFLAFLDADDYWDRSCLEKLAGALTGGAALSYCGWQHVGAKNRSNEPFIPKDYEAPQKLEMLLAGGSPWPIHAALVRRAVIAEVGGFREDLETSLDFELWLRIASRHTVVRVPEVLAYYRFHGDGQISARPWRQAINGWRVKRRLLAENPDFLLRLPAKRTAELVEGGLLNRGYQFYWKRDLVSARHVFRWVLRTGAWHIRDLRYVLPALLPEGLYVGLVNLAERRG